jgi:ParB family chromosome partitioning protein
MEFKMIPVDKIRPNPFQPRERSDKEKLQELAESIKESDLVQPILVRRDGDTYEIIAGERRWRAYQFAGLKEIPAIVREPRPDDIETRELSLIENWHRLNLESHEAERFIYQLWVDGKSAGRYNTITDMARKLGMNYPTLFTIIKAYEDRRKLGISGDTTYTDFRETEILRDEPELRKQVLELRAEEKIKRDELRHFSKIIKEHPELAEYAIKLKEKGKPVDEIERSVKFVATQPEDVKQDFIEAGLEVEVPIEQEIKVEIPEEEVKEIKARVEEIDREIEEIKSSPEYREKERLRRNWMAHSALLGSLGDAFCPICGADWRNLKWVCHNLDLQQAQAIARDRFQEAIRRSKKEGG